MDGGVSTSRVGGISAALILLAAVPLASVATADQRVARTTFAPIPTPTIETQSFALPYAAPKFDLGSVESRKFAKEVPELSMDKLDLGKSALQLNIADASTQPTPGTPDLTNVIVPLAPGKKRGTRRYFGLILTTVTD